MKTGRPTRRARPAAPMLGRLLPSLDKAFSRRYRLPETRATSEREARAAPCEAGDGCMRCRSSRVIDSELQQCSGRECGHGPG